jgi:hypothetical protein
MERKKEKGRRRECMDEYEERRGGKQISRRNENKEVSIQPNRTRHCELTLRTNPRRTLVDQPEVVGRIEVVDV